MSCLFFGPPQRRLFGIHHPPSEPVGHTAVLLCNPFGHEALRTHRFYRLLAERLSRRGMAVLRFDYHGTGDSPGEDLDGEMEGWAQDIRTAHHELLRISGARDAVWFGARLGARLALQAAATEQVRRLVLWDPVFDGRAYLEELRQAHVQELELSHSIPDPRWRRALAHDALAFTSECLGFAISPALRAQILALRPEHIRPSRTTSLTVLASPQEEAGSHGHTTEHTEGAAGITMTSFRHPLIWTSNPHANNEAVPADALQRMTEEIHAHS